MLYLLLITSFITAISVYLDKRVVNLGISKKDYFFYMCFSTLPFAMLMMIVEPQKFEFTLYPILLIILACGFRYIKQHTVVGCLKHLHPYEYISYTSLSLLIAFFIDIFLGVKNFTLFSFLSVVFTLVGIFILSDSKLKLKALQKEIILRIFSTLILGYIGFYILKYWSNAFYMFALNFLLASFFIKDYINIKEQISKKKIILWVFIQQTVGFFGVYLSNILVQNSVTMMSYIRPVSLVFIIFLAPLFKKSIDTHIKIKDVLAVILIAIGLFLI